MYSGNFTVAQVGWFTYLNTYLLLICGVVGIVFGTGGTIYVTI
ncbi:amino acid permease [Leishmania donovani]|nr:amino acid permease [Leishmania donovani]CBZ36583.1 amino acid permease [Leishmania donovani]